MKQKKAVVMVLKLGLAVGLLAYLVYQAQGHQRLDSLRKQPKDWSLLLGAGGCFLVAVLLTFVRWYALIRTLGLPVRLGDAMRLGFLGYAFNFVSLGNVGGDFLKAVFIAQRHPGQRTEAVATVVVDRLVGLYALFLLASGAILMAGFDRQATSTPLTMICRTTLWSTALCTVALVVLLAVRVGAGPAGQRLSRLPWVGRLPWIESTLARLLSAAAIYRRNLWVLVAATIGSLCVHSLFAVGIYLIARGLPGAAPTLIEHFLITPVSMVVGAVPITPSGLGTFEAALEYMYRFVGNGDSGPVASGSVVSGVIVGLGYRLITVLIAMVGVCFYFARRGEVDHALHDAESTEVAR